jgi:hypothetical protein
METVINSYRFVVGKSERKRPLVRLNCVEENKIKMDLKVISCQVMDWIHLPAASSCEDGYELSGPIKSGEFLEFLSNYKFSRW